MNQLQLLVIQHHRFSNRNVSSNCALNGNSVKSEWGGNWISLSTSIINTVTASSNRTTQKVPSEVDGTNRRVSCELPRHTTSPTRCARLSPHPYRFSKSLAGGAWNFQHTARILRWGLAAFCFSQKLNRWHMMLHRITVSQVALHHSEGNSCSTANAK